MRPVRGFVNINTPHHQTHNRYIYRSDLTVNFCWRLLIPIYYVLFKNNSFWVNNMTQTINKKTIKNNSLVLPETIEFSWSVKSTILLNPVRVKHIDNERSAYYGFWLVSHCDYLWLIYLHTV